MKKVAVALSLLVLAVGCEKKQKPNPCIICFSQDSLDVWNGYKTCDLCETQVKTFMLLKTRKGDTTRCIADTTLY